MKWTPEEEEELKRLIAENPGYEDREEILRNPEDLKKFEPEPLVDQIKNKTGIDLRAFKNNLINKFFRSKFF